MPRRKSESGFGRKPGYFEKLKMGTSHPTYNPAVEGYGDSTEWNSTFYVRMGWKEAQEHKANRGWKNDWKVLSEIAGVVVNENSMWSEIKAAFRKAAMNCHPDRVTQHGMTKEQAEDRFKDASAAYAMLENVYRMEKRLQ